MRISAVFCDLVVQPHHCQGWSDISCMGLIGLLEAFCQQGSQFIPSSAVTSQHCLQVSALPFIFPYTLGLTAYLFLPCPC